MRRTAGIGMEDPISPRNLMLENHPHTSHTLCQKKIPSGAGADAAQPTNLVPIVNAREICRAIDSQARERQATNSFGFASAVLECPLASSPARPSASVPLSVVAWLVLLVTLFFHPFVSFCAQGRTQDRDQTLKDLFLRPDLPYRQEASGIIVEIM